MKLILKLGTIIAISLAFSSCSYGVSKQNTKEETKSNEQLVQVQAPVKIPTIQETVNTLCSDEFEGRLVVSKGNEKVGEYISKTFKDIGLASLFGDSYYEPYAQEVYKKYGVIDKNDKSENKGVHNVIGVIKGKDSKNAVFISAHFDHVGYEDGKIIRGALDDASGMSALIKIAHTLKEYSKEKPFDMDIVLCAFNGEEEALSGSRAFVNDIKSKSVYSNMYNINIDCIGAKKGGTNLALKDKSKISGKLYNAIKVTLKKDNIGFGDTAVKGSGDHMSFERANIPNVFIVQEGIEKLVHKPTDTPDILDYGQIYRIANAISDFVEANNGVIFN
ncbi:M28 family peptidase [Clostridium scatologenes]|uniref:Protein containing aminopeptidase domain n=1 Tax=Clostridium scatologenes TaxID=1548 RepID=A0A0E3K241_CLOSL|nr:M28 family peptidase [Clostridium scatologenes]AKA70462.1 protein containing aminopeptidase domain [Clostridium scatologenes]